MYQTQINPTEINISDAFYTFTYNRISAILEQSIRTMGMLYPVILEELENHRYRIVSGSRRVNAAFRLSLPRIPAIIYTPDEKSPLQLFLINLHENLSIRQLNAIEKSRVLYKLRHEFKIPENTIVETYMPLLQLVKNPKILEMYLQFNQLEDEIQAAIVDDFIGLEMALKLLDFSRGNRESFFRLAKRLRLGKNRQRELLNLLLDLSKRDDQTFSQIIDTGPIQEILVDESIPTPLKAERVRHLFRTQRYPRFTEVERKFNNLMKQMKLPGTISITPFPYFEQSKFTMKVEFTDQDDFKGKLAFLQKLVAEGYISQLDDLS